MADDGDTDIRVLGLRAGQVDEHAIGNASDGIGDRWLIRVEVTADRGFANQAGTVTHQLSQGNGRGALEGHNDVEVRVVFGNGPVDVELALFSKLHGHEGREELRNGAGPVNGVSGGRK